MSDMTPEGKPTDFWDRHGVRWVFEVENQLWHSELPDDPHPPVVGPGALDEDRQPTYGNEPNVAQQVHAEIEREIEG